MQVLTVDENSINIRIDKYLQNTFPGLAYGTLQKAFRKKDIKVNGIRVGKDYFVKPGDILEVYITDDLLTGSNNNAASIHNKSFTVVYEDENILLVNKMQGIPVHPDRGQSQQTLIDLVREYLAESENYQANKAGFQPALCHRLDRNTGGLVIIAKNQESHDIMLKKLKTHEVKKYYQCMVKGRMDKPEAILKAYLWKDSAKNRVYIDTRKIAGSREIITGYNVIEYYPVKDVSRLEVELITGRTHQIRAHLAFLGHPVIGDGKYGTNAINRLFNLKYQALWAYKLRFVFSENGSMLDYLNGREFTADPDLTKIPQFAFLAQNEESRI